MARMIRHTGRLRIASLKVSPNSAGLSSGSEPPDVCGAFRRSRNRTKATMNATPGQPIPIAAKAVRQSKAATSFWVRTGAAVWVKDRPSITTARARPRLTWKFADSARFQTIVRISSCENE